MQLADEGLAQLASTVDTVITIPNNRLLKLVPRGTSFFEAFNWRTICCARRCRASATSSYATGDQPRFRRHQGIHDRDGLRHDGDGDGERRERRGGSGAQAISCPLLEDTRIAGSRSMLINITGSTTLGFHEVNEACTIIREAAECDDVQINFGVILNESMGDAVKITVIATGFQPESAPVAERPAPVTPVIRVQPRPARAGAGVMPRGRRAAGSPSRRAAAIGGRADHGYGRPRYAGVFAAGAVVKLRQGSRSLAVAAR